MKMPAEANTTDAAQDPLNPFGRATLRFELAAQQRLSLLQWALAAGFATFLPLAAFEALRFSHSNSWQILALLLSAILATLCLAAASALLARKRLSLAGYTLLAGYWLVFGSIELFVSGATLITTLAGSVLLLTLGLLVIPRRTVATASALLLFFIEARAVEQIGPHWRYAFTSFGVPQEYLGAYWAVAWIAILAGVLWVYFRLNGTIRSRIMTSFVMVVLMIIVVTSAGTVIIGIQNAQKNTYNQLATVSDLKESAIDTWTSMLRNTLVTSMAGEDFRLRAASILSGAQAQGSSQEIETQKGLLREQLQHTMQGTNLFDDLFLVDANGKLAVAALGEAAGQSRIEGDWAKFSQGLTGAYVSPVFISRDGAGNSSFSLIAAMPVTDANDKVVGVFAGRANISSLRDIILRGAGQAASTETLLVGTNSTGMSTSKGYTDFAGRYVTSPGIEQALAQQDGQSVYVNYRGVTVLGEYRWVPQIQVAMLTEQDQASVYQPLFLTLGTNIGISLIVLILALVGAFIISKNIATPLRSLAATAIKVAQGNLNLRAPQGRDDETNTLATAFNSMTEQLGAMIATLEERVAERTLALERRTAQIQTASEIAKDITSLTTLEELLDRAVELIPARLGFYHAGIFLIDAQGEYAVLQAASGEIGKTMIERHHRLKVGEVGIVGSAVGTGKPHIASDVSIDDAHFKNPLLPETHSELALPLSVNGVVIGALDVQSKDPSAFQEADVQVLQTMADQLATAIDKARLMQAVQQNLEELEATYKQTTRQAWRGFLSSSRKSFGYRFRGLQLEPALEMDPVSTAAIRQGETIQANLATYAPQNGNANRSVLAVPIKYREQVLGVVNLQFEGSAVPEDILSFVQVAVERLGLALENARLLEEINHRAERARRERALHQDPRIDGHRPDLADDHPRARQDTGGV